MHKDWDEVLKEDISPELEHKTMARVRQELEKRAETRANSWWLPIVSLVPVLGLLMFFLRPGLEQREQILTSNEHIDEFFEIVDLLDIDSGEDMELSLFDEMELIEDLESLEEWDGREEA